MSTTRWCLQQSLQLRKDMQMSNATHAYRIRQLERMVLESSRKISTRKASRARVKRSSGNRKKINNKSEKRLVKESTIQPTITDEPASASPAYTFRARKSRFPDPKHCNFSYPTAAQIFSLPKPKAGGSAGTNFSARFAPQTAMVMQATDPKSQPNQPNQPQPSDPATQVSGPANLPKYGKTSSIGLYLKYNPGSTICSLQKITCHVRTNEYATVGNKTALQQTVLYFNFLTSTVRIAETLGETDRQKFYFGFRKPPPVRDKIDLCGTAFHSTVMTKGATLRSEHYQAFRRPPPYRDKHSELIILSE